MKILLVLNDPPYGTERSYNALRLGRNLLTKEAGEVRMFLLGDAAACAKGGQKVPQGYYNVADLVAGAARSTLDQLTEWSVWADKVLVF